METAKDWVTNLFKGNGHTGKCEVCGNEYDQCFEVRVNGATHTFDCFECAIQSLAPRCANCGCHIIGHGMAANGVYYCCAHCARQNGVHNLEDNVTMERSKV